MASGGGLLSSLAFLLLAVGFVLSSDTVMENPSQQLQIPTITRADFAPASIILLPRSFWVEEEDSATDPTISHADAAKGCSNSLPPLPPSATPIASSPSSSTASSTRMPRGFLHNESEEATSCPASCFRANPVCGVNGVTYWCGSADAKCEGVEVDYEGFCDFGSIGTAGGRGVLAAQSLLLVHMIWLMLACFLVLIGVP